jgi:UDP-glucose 4-epimerase
MAVLVTGGAGFIGSHLIDYYLERTEHRVLVLDNVSTGREGNLSASNRLEFVEGDVRDADLIEGLVERSDLVYHLAAAVGVERVVESPLESLRTNVQGTENVLDAAARDGTPVFVASSSEVYGKSPEVPFSESDDRVVGPTSVPRWGYANAKALDEFYALAHHEENDLPVVVGRFFNTVGPRQVGEYGMVVPTFVEQALAGDPITVYGDGTQTRCFTHVQDAVEAIHELMNTPEATGDVFNIGSSQPVSINELAERVLEITGSDSPIEHIPFEEAFGEDFEEPTRREPDVSKLRETIGWAPETSLDRILEDVVEERRGDVEASS